MLRFLPLLLLFALASAQVPSKTLDFQTWSQQFYNTDGTGRVAIVGICNDLLNNTFAVGWASGNFDAHITAGPTTAIVMKFDSNGNRLFIRYLDSLLHDEASKCATDSTGGVVVTGRTAGYLSTFTDVKTAGSFNLFIARFDSIGVLSWVRQLDNDNAGFSVKVDANNNAYCLYIKSQSIRLFQVLSNGTITWNTGSIGSQTTSSYLGSIYYSYRTAGYQSGVPTDIISDSTDQIGDPMDCDSLGNCYIGFSSQSGVGVSNGTAGSGYDAYLQKVNSAGVLQWSLVLGSAATETVFTVRLDAFGNAWMGGATNGILGGQPPYGGQDAFVSKVSPTAQVLFTRVFGTLQDQAVHLLASDGKGGMYAAVAQHNTYGSSTPGGDFLDNIQVDFYNDLRFVYVISFDSYGNRVWDNLINAGLPAGYSTYQRVLAPLSMSVNIDGTTLTIAGKYTGLFNEAFSQYPNYLERPKGFIFSAAPQSSCNATRFNSIMSDINDLLTSLGV